MSLGIDRGVSRYFGWKIRRFAKIAICIDQNRRIRRFSGNNFRYRLIDPTEQDPEEKKALVKYLAERGILPINLNRRSEDETYPSRSFFPTDHLRSGNEVAQFITECWK